MFDPKDISRIDLLIYMCNSGLRSLLHLMGLGMIENAESHPDFGHGLQELLYEFYAHVKWAWRCRQSTRKVCLMISRRIWITGKISKWHKLKRQMVLAPFPRVLSEDCLTCERLARDNALTWRPSTPISHQSRTRGNVISRTVWPWSRVKILTKIKLQSLNQISAKKFWLKFSFKILTKL